VRGGGQVLYQIMCSLFLKYAGNGAKNKANTTKEKYTQKIMGRTNLAYDEV